MMWNDKASAHATEHGQPPLAKPSMMNPAVAERRGTAWIGESVVFKGELISAEDLRIEGRVEGTIEVRNHHVVIGTHANIQADVHAKTITVRGTASGTLTASDRIEIGETASIQGNITAPRLTIADGATVEGLVQTGPRHTDAETSQPGLATVN
jgi:cytoskeletal protein CcmA (bactofilin family)